MNELDRYFPDQSAKVLSLAERFSRAAQIVTTLVEAVYVHEEVLSKVSESKLLTSETRASIRNWLDEVNQPEASRDLISIIVRREKRPPWITPGLVSAAERLAATGLNRLTGVETAHEDS